MRGRVANFFILSGVFLDDQTDNDESGGDQSGSGQTGSPATRPPRPRHRPPSFVKFGLDERLLKAITEMGYERPTPIQEQAIPLC